MIVWIASYPRSGNSVLRQILHFTMDKVSYSEDVESSEIWGVPEAWGRYSNYKEFHAWASQAPETVFVKTHLLPNDANPAIYVVRDGRAAISSFLKLERHLSPDSPSNSLLHLILGDHYYSSWSEHYRAWHGREEGPILTLQYNNLFEAGPDVLEEIAAFAGYTGPIAPWTNPIDEWRKLYPDFVGEGKTRWVPSAEWDFVCDHAFWELHGELMRELGLDDERRIEAPSEDAVLMTSQLLPALKSWVDRVWTLERTWKRSSRERDLQAAAADQRLAVIAELRRELDVQRQEAENRLASLDALTRERDLHAQAAEERLVLIKELTQARDAEAEAASERLALIDELARDRDLHAQAAEERLKSIDELRREHTAVVEQLTRERDQQATAAMQRLAALEGIDRDRNLHADQPPQGWR